MSMSQRKSKWTAAPISDETKLRLIKLKGPKKNRKPREHVLETLDDVINRVLDFWEEHHKGGEK